MSAPKRIQLRRTKGWRKPEGAVVVARPSKWGNPFKVGETVQIDLGPDATGPVRFLRRKRTRAEVVDAYRRLTSNWRPDKVRTVRAELAGRDLACWCPLDQPCHADALLEIANGGAS